MARAFRIRKFDALTAALVAAFAWLVVATSRSDLGGYAPLASDVGAGGFQPLGWRDLKLLDHESGEADPRLAEFDGGLVRVPGYIVPLEDLQSRASHFLLVPYVGACIHAPSPPANQIVAVEMGGGAVEFEMWEAYWVSGRLSIESVESPFGSAAFQMEGIRIDPFERSE